MSSSAWFRRELFSGTLRQERALTAILFAFFAIHAVYNFTFFFRVDLRLFAAQDAFTYRPDGLLWVAPRLEQWPGLFAFAQYGFTLVCLWAAWNSPPSLALRMTALVLGFAYFSILHSYIHETNIEYVAFLVLLALGPAPERRSHGQANVFSPSCFLLWLLLSLLYLNSAVTHSLHFEQWLRGLPLKNLFVVKLNNDLNWTPLATDLMRALVEWLPQSAYRVMGLSTLVFDWTFWLCLFFRRPRRYFLAFGFLFHFGCVFLMNVVFAPLFPVYAGLWFWEFSEPDRRG